MEASPVGRATLGKIAWRLIPFLGVLYFFAFLDRVNVGFAALTMNADLGLSSAAFGIGAGIFFVGYIIFEIPSNVMLERFGARLWIARIMISWGLLSAAMALVQGPKTFYTVRFLLGVAEAGFFPGIMYYLMCWFPQKYLARIIALFIIALPLSSVVGAPLSTALLDINVGGLRGWQWMFLVEAIPTIVLGVIVLRVLPDQPSKAKWLRPEEKHWIASELFAQRAGASHGHAKTLREGLMSPRVWCYGLIYFCMLAGLYGFSFWLPQIVGSLSARSNLQVGLMTMVPYSLACVALVLWGRHSDASAERAWHIAAPSLLAAAALAAGAWSVAPYLVYVVLCLAAVGIYSGLPCFWAMVSRGMQSEGAAAAGAIALVNSLGSFGGFFGPAAIGLAKDLTGSYGAGFLLIAFCLVIGAMIALLDKNDRRPGGYEGLNSDVPG